MVNKALQATPTALGNFSIRLSHNGVVVCHGVLPVVRARSGRLKAGVMPANSLYDTMLKNDDHF
jgi:hypothetical protein